MKPVHPGEILVGELEEIGLSPDEFASALAMPASRVSAILDGRCPVSANTALRLSRYFGATPQLWLNLQQTYDLRVAEIESGEDIASLVKLI